MKYITFTMFVLGLTFFGFVMAKSFSTPRQIIVTGREKAITKVCGKSDWVITFDTSTSTIGRVWCNFSDAISYEHHLSNWKGYWKVEDNKIIYENT